MAHGAESRSPRLPAFEEDTVLLGRLAIALAAYFPQWVRRRTTTFTFLDEKAYVQRLDVNLRLPSRAWFSDGKGGDLAALLDRGLWQRVAARAGRLPETIYVPLNVVRKGALAAFRIADADNNAVSMRNRAERCRLTVDAFSSLVDRYARDRLGRAPGAFREQIEAIVVAQRPQKGEQEFERAMGGELGRLLSADDPYRQLLWELSIGFMVLVPVPFAPADHLFTGMPTSQW